MVTKKILYLIAGICLLFLFACAPKPRAPQAVLDTPEHHVSNGNKFLKAERINEAFSEFRKAIELDPKFSAAYAGLGLIYGLKNDLE
ncbi:MAG: tetratricopeptide repeat protein, partial [Desulfobacteraceae bacterium]|nr:tetratricopeptide repeat protein [Desulfobacteraceae bacterium]